MAATFLSFKVIYTLAVLITLFAVMLFTKAKAEIAFLCAMIALYVGGILDIQGTFGGFASESVLIVAAMFGVVAGLTHTGVLNWIVQHLMGIPKGPNSAIVRVMVPVAFLSSVLSNTTVVALFVNIIKMWSRKLGVSPSKLLIPLSYASGMGGILTLIGTPPNLIISGMYAEDTGIQMGIFTPFLCGLFCLIVGILSMLAMKNLLPDRQSPMDSVNDSDFTTELTVPSDNIIAGMGIREAHEYLSIEDPKTQIVAIRRFDDYVITPVEDTEYIFGGDRFLVSGKVADIKRYAHLMGLKNEVLETVIDNDDLEQHYNWKTLASALILIASILLSAFKVIPLLQSCLLASVAMLVLKSCTPNQFLKSINWGILIILASSIAIGKAIEQSGLASIISSGLLTICGTNPYVVLAIICLVSTFITEFISNTAAGAMFYPIAMSAATALGANPVTFCVALMISVSSSFATPIGSPTHMLVYMPGGYKFSDFARIGLIMNIVILAANLFITPIVFPF